MRLARGALALGAAAALAVAPARFGMAEELSFSLPEARALAREAFRRGDVAVANALSKGLVQARPDDAGALVILAATEPLLGRPKAGRQAGRLAFRAADSRTLKREAAYYTARAAAQDSRHFASQIWLRRAYQLAETETQRDRIAGAFSEVRRVSPWSVQLHFNVAPSSNVNGGASSDVLVIDETLPVGKLSGAARALSGTVASLSADISYAVLRTGTHRTELGVMGYRSFVSLTEEAQDLAPGVEGSDFDYAVGEVNLRHQWARPWGPLPDRYEIALGQTWYGGEELDRYGKVELSRDIRLPWDWTARITGEAERRLSDRDAQDQDASGWRLDIGRRIGAAGHHLSFGVAAREVRSDDVNADYSLQSVRASFAMGQDVMGLRLSGELSYSERDYDAFTIGFLRAPEGRKDSTFAGRLSLHIDAVDYMGFTPVVSLTGRETQSNISRFESDTLGLSVGIRSAF